LITKGASPSWQGYNYTNDTSQTLFVTSENVREGMLDLSEPKYLEDGFNDKQKRSMLKKGDFLINIVGASIGRAARFDLDVKANINQAVALVRMGQEEVLSNYMMYYLNSPRALEMYDNMKSAVARANLSLQNIADLEILIPEKNEQEQFSLFLKQSDKSKFIGFKSQFIEMFGDPVDNPKGWKTKGLLELGKCKNGMNFSAGESGENIHCLGVGDFKDYSEISDTSILPMVSLNKMPPEEVMLQDGDIVFVRSNGNKMLVGRCLVVFPGNVPTTYSGFCIRFRKENRDVDTTYLLQLLKADSTRRKMAGRGANIQNLNQQILGELKIPMPPVESQQEFKEFIKQSDKSKLKKERKNNE